MTEITTVGVDLAKNVIVVCAAGVAGRATAFKQFSFRGFGEWAANLPPCTVGMEACERRSAGTSSAANAPSALQKTTCRRSR
jgi:transposase